MPDYDTFADLALAIEDWERQGKDWVAACLTEPNQPDPDLVRYLLDTPPTMRARLIGYASVERRRFAGRCAHCGKPIIGYETKRYCNDRCRAGAAYQRGKERKKA